MLVTGLAGIGLGYRGPGGPPITQDSWHSPALPGPNAPQTATQAGFGTLAGSHTGATHPASVRRIGLGVRALGTVCLVALVAIYCSLPK
jgi:hypothetical protein